MPVEEITVKPWVVVAGCTGLQGGSVFRTLAATGKYNLRGLTRNPDARHAQQRLTECVSIANSEAAAKITSPGPFPQIELVKCDLNNSDELHRAFHGAYAVYAVTNFWDPEIAQGTPEKEEEQGRRMAEVASECGVKHYFWSSLPNVYNISNGKYTKVIHFDGKARVEEFIREFLPDLPTTFIELGFYMQNLVNFFPPTVIHEGGSEVYEYALPMRPDALLPFVDTAGDTGSIVAHVLDKPERYVGINIPVASEYLSMNEVIDIFQKVTGKRARYKQVKPEDFIKKLEPGLGRGPAEELTEMFQYIDEFGYYGGEDISKTRKHIHPDIKKFEQWLREDGFLIVSPVRGD
ncbi:hypothetical protein HK102_001272 [Quaeritorhiza haematococci]|nr:hypothetical protein HK102_001272 [Quaeritorhiza haematococci]